MLMGESAISTDEWIRLFETGFCTWPPTAHRDIIARLRTAEAERDRWKVEAGSQAPFLAELTKERDDARAEVAKMHTIALDVMRERDAARAVAAAAQELLDATHDVDNAPSRHSVPLGRYNKAWADLRATLAALKKGTSLEDRPVCGCEGVQCRACAENAKETK